jgi:hypothetical protein
MTIIMKPITAALLLALGLALIGCGGQPLDANRMKGADEKVQEGPGLFTGQDGVFRIGGKVD